MVTTAVAESSLTVPGVRAVVDPGSPGTAHDQARGLGALVTTRVSQASAEQRAGRAAREGQAGSTGAGQPDHATSTPTRRPRSRPPTWPGSPWPWRVGGAGRSRLGLARPPPPVALEPAITLLHRLDAVDDDGRITARGRQMATIGAHPRLARAVLDGAALVGAERAREIVALLSDSTVAGRDDDLPARWEALRRGRDREASARWREEITRLGRGGAPATERSDEAAVGMIVGLAYPDRLARARQPGSADYQLAGGPGARLDPDSALRGSEWLAVAVADRPIGRPDARIRSAAPIDEADARTVAADLVRGAEQIAWQRGQLVARRVETLGAIELSATPLLDPDPLAVRVAVLDGLRRSGPAALSALNFTVAATGLRQRLAFCHQLPRPALAGDGRRRPAGPPGRVARPGPAAGAPQSRPGRRRRHRRTAPAAALAGGRPAGRASPRTPAGAVRLAGVGALRRGGPASDRGQGAGGVRVDEDADPGRRAGPRWCCTCSHRPAAPWRSPPTWPRSGCRAIPRCGPTYEPATRATPGRKIH